MAGTTIAIFQPQLDRWSGNTLEAHAAVVIQKQDSDDNAKGVIWFEARPEVDKVSRLVTLEDFKVTRYNFPSLVNNGLQYLAAFRSPPSMQTIPLDLLVPSFIATKTTDEEKTYQLENEEPRIICSSRPAVLVLIDGDPVFRQARKHLQTIINTRALIAFDPDKQVYYLALMDGWLRASAETRQWSLVKDAQAKSLDTLRRAARQTSRNHPLGSPKQSLKQAFEKGQVPAIYLSTVPAELLVTYGQPKFAKVTGTKLLYVENSSNNIFLDASHEMFYILVSGRWFRSNSLQDGQWSYVTATDLPSDFAKIPALGPKASVLVSVPGTPQAKEALIANQIPQAVAISRKATILRVAFYGTPDFQRIEGTHLLYAVNATTPIVYVPASKTYYAVQNAVWFASPNAAGPWTVAVSIPRAIYAIPPSCPIHYVTYVKVFGYTSTTVYMGYTPGYCGTVVSQDNIVVYGTGWSYTPYVGSADWAPQPHTYGVGAAFSWSATAGWGFAKSAGDGTGEASTVNVCRRWEHGVCPGTRWYAFCSEAVAIQPTHR